MNKISIKCQKPLERYFKITEKQNKCLFNEYVIINTDAYGFFEKTREAIALEGEIYKNLSSILVVIGESKPEELGDIIESYAVPLKNSGLMKESDKRKQIINDLFVATTTSRNFCKPN
jgi:hypothetical protein